MFSRKVVVPGQARCIPCFGVALLLILWAPVLARPLPADPQGPPPKPKAAGKDKAGETPEARDKKKEEKGEETEPGKATAKDSGKDKTKDKAKDATKETTKSSSKGIAKGAQDPKKGPAKDGGKSKGSDKVEPAKESGKGADKKPEDSKSAEPAKDKEPGKKAEGAKAATPDPDAAFVKENLERLLYPSSSKFLDDGRVTLEFDFGEKKEEHSDIFNIQVGRKLKEPFRWTLRDEEWETGLRVSNAGLALLKAWFKDEVEAEMEFFQHINHEPKHIAAVVFANGKGAAIASNYGGQCAVLSGGRISQAKGKTIPVSHDTAGRIKLVVKNGTFEAHRDGRQRATSKCSPKTYSSGQIGFYWGGSISGTITKLTITGRLDNAKMAAEIRKGVKS